MKQYETHRQTYLNFFLENLYWLYMNALEAALGAIWVGMVGAFIMFFYKYFHFYYMGVHLKKRSYYLTYLDFVQVREKIVVTFLLFLMATYFASRLDEFWPMAFKGFLLGALIWPPIYLHYSDEDEYKFQLSKND